MTLPAVVLNTQNRALYTQLQKSYSVLQNALQQMNYEQGFVAKPGAYGTSEFYPVFKKYLMIAKDCNYSDCESKYETAEDGSQQWTNISSNYKTYSNKQTNNNLFDDGQGIFLDGSMILIQNETSNGSGSILITVDVNGIKKKPNRWGHDLFTFQIMDNGKLMPMGAKGTSYSEASCSPSSASTLNGIGCTYKALTDKDFFKNLPK